MPKLWDETVEAHRRGVREAILATTATLVTEHGLRSVTMSRIAEEAGIGRATLYRYFPDVEAILSAWHEQQVEAHLGRLRELREGAGSAAQRLAAVLETYAHLSRGSRGRHDSDLGAVMHRADHVSRAGHRVRDLLRDLVAEGAAAGEFRGDVPPGELAGYCLHALAAIGDGSAEGRVVDRLVNVILAGLRPPP